MNVKFAVKDKGHAALTGAIKEFLEREDAYSETSVFTRATGGFILRCVSKRRIVKGEAMLNIRFSLQSAGRRAFANAIGEALGEDVVYNGTPNFTYTIGGYVVGRDGGLTCPDGESSEEISRLISDLNERGYAAEVDYDSLRMTEREALGLGRERRDPWGEDGPRPSGVPETDGALLAVEMPRARYPDAAVANLKKIVASKEALIKNALGADSLSVEITEDMLRFPWFTLTGADGESNAYTRFIYALCEMAKNQKHVTAKEREVTNEKFTMRVFLIRLGFIGPDYKAARRILLQNLTGNSSWKNGRPPERDTADTADASAETEK